MATEDEGADASTTKRWSCADRPGASSSPTLRRTLLDRRAFRRRVKTQGSLPSEDAAVVLLFSLVATGQIKLRRIDGWQKIATVLSQNTLVAA
jgi:hypothetical protein